MHSLVCVHPAVQGLYESVPVAALVLGNLPQLPQLPQLPGNHRYPSMSTINQACRLQGVVMNHEHRSTVAITQCAIVCHLCSIDPVSAGMESGSVLYFRKFASASLTCMRMINLELVVTCEARLWQLRTPSTGYTCGDLTNMVVAVVTGL